MNLLKLSKPMLLSSSLLLFTACGGGDSGTTTDPQEIAIDRLEAYAANNNNPPPTLEDYLNAGVQGVDDDNLDEINAVVDRLEAEDVDSVEEINTLVSQLGINIIPVAKVQSINLNEDSSKAILLEGTDIDGDTLTYSVVNNPNHGTLTGTVPNLTYTPNVNYNGLDDFTFKVNDGEADSSVAKVSITVNSVNDAPKAKAQGVSLDEDIAKAIVLESTDDDGDTLTYTLVTQPTQGTLTGTAPNLTYVPNLNYFGTDSFSFKVNDTKVDSEVVTVDLNINPINDLPTVEAGVDKTVEVNKGIRLIATGSDVEGAVGFVWRKGDKVLAQIPVFDYVPTQTGAENLTVTVTDNEGVSVSDSMLLMVVAKPNIAPVAEEQALTFEEDSIENQITLTATDVDGDTLTYTVVTQPTHGVLDGVAPDLTYTPTADYFGEDVFEFKANDGKVDSAVVTVTISVSSVNDAPVLQKNNLTVSFDEHNVSINTNPNATYGVDMDKDGDKDFLVASTEGEPLLWYENDGNQNFTEHNISTSFSTGWSVKAVDIDLDSDIDILFSTLNNTLVWYENDGSQNFIEHNISTLESLPWWIDSGDVDKDGDLDIISSDEGGKVKWWENDGSQNFTEHNLSDVGNWSYIVMDDLNQDGSNDFIVTEEDENRIVWYQNDGTENFVEYNITSTLHNASSVYITDIDNDGDIDIIGTGDNMTVLYENDGSQNFTEYNISNHENIIYGSIYVADIDDDGDMDIVNSRVWFENIGDLNFQQHELSPFAPYFDAIDLDGDGDLDILSPYYNSAVIAWQENLGLTTIYVKENNVSVGTMVATDVDGDSLTYSISGVDADKFNINATTGVLTFNDAPDHENPIDEDENNIYELNVAVTDGIETDSLDIKVIVENEGEPSDE